MKKFLILCLLLSIAGKIFSQADTAMPQPSIKTDYLKKSKTQKTVAWLLLGSGTVMVATGVIVARNSIKNEPSLDNTFTGALLIVAGVATDLASIPFFIAGTKNKRRALAVSFKNELAPQLRQGSLVQTALPSVSLVIRL